MHAATSPLTYFTGSIGASAVSGSYAGGGSGAFSGSKTVSAGPGGGSANADALDYPQIGYTFSCASGGTTTIQVSNGVCVAQQKAYAKAVSCNDYDADFTFKSVGRPFYQCAVDNSTGDFKATYQQYLTYFGG